MQPSTPKMTRLLLLLVISLASVAFADHGPVSHSLPHRPAPRPHAAPGPYHAPAPKPYHPPAPKPYHAPAPAPYPAPAPAPYHPPPPKPYHAPAPAPKTYHPKPAPKPYHPPPPKAHYDEDPYYDDEPVVLCPNYPYCTDAPYGIYHLQEEIEALRQRNALIAKVGENLVHQQPNRPFVGDLY